MRKAILLGFVLLGVTPVGASADIGWCYRDFGSDKRICGMPNLRQCLAAANAMGGRCEQDNAANAKAEEPKKTGKAK